MTKREYECRFDGGRRYFDKCRDAIRYAKTINPAINPRVLAWGNGMIVWQGMQPGGIV